MTICIVDTSIVLELLNVPGYVAQHSLLLAEFAIRQRKRESFLLSLVVLIETGNHIAHVADGSARRKSAEDFVAFAVQALDGKLPFVPTPSPDAEQIRSWLADFPTCAMAEIGLADRSLIALWDGQRELHQGRRVYIWSLDKHLSGYDTGE